jgi:hypothetical protein
MESKSKFITGLNLDKYKCIDAEKNISVSAEYKYVLVNLEFRDDRGWGFRLSSSYAVNLGGQISKYSSAKVVFVHLLEGKKLKRDRLAAFSGAEVTEELLNAINDINNLFESVDTENKRVYL